MTHPKTGKNLQLIITVRKFGMFTFRIKTEMWILKQKRCQKTIDKGCINQGQVADDLIKIKKGGSMKIVPWTN